MRLLNYATPDGPSVAGCWDGRWVDLSQADPTLPRSALELLCIGPSIRSDLAALAARAEPLAQVPSRLLPPVMRPGKILCVGLNYRDHARETGQPIPDEPLIFNKLPSSLLGHGEAIVLPEASHKIDFEAELVIVIGKRGRHIAPDAAYQYIAGYCCGNDISARDWQKEKPGGQWLLGKSFDTFAPLGPWVVSAEEIEDPGNLDIVCRVNGKTMQNSSTSNLIFPVPQLIGYISRVCTLEPGDLLFTGTPAGVGVARSPAVFLQSGDRVEVEIERIGVLSNGVVAAE
ncbi:MAG: fumarylacetoacetate hydrolase family protein [Planctomycetota bacterium]|nr:fumarylacetoacetate hydrolase family protein [Planctomycetota bacterium]